ncbi:MAG: radical SAM protein [candidate division WOR-3 bacterium]|nr:MAG: radical SAM protein [candidate division WOR-3 bacterium]
MKIRMPILSNLLKEKIPKLLKVHKVIWETENYGLTDLAMDSMREFDLGWVDDFICKIRPYVCVRKIDRLLILVPNQVYGLNESGIEIMSYLLSGHTITDLLLRVGNDENKRRDIHYFFCDLRAIMKGCLRDNEKRNAVDYHEFSDNLNVYPILSEVAVTYRCNLACEFCYVGDHCGRELSTNDLKKILFKIYHEAKVPSVSFTGGEPLLREDIAKLISYAAQIGLWTNLITNGTLLYDDTVRSLKKAGLSSAQVSIEGPNSEIHDMITGKQGAFDASTRGIASLRDAGIPVHTNTTLSRHNIAYAKEIVVLAKCLGLNRLSMNLLIPCGRAGSREDLWTSYSEIGDHIIDIKRFAEEQDVRFLWYSPVPLCMFNPIASGLGNKACAAITGLLSIDPTGNIIPCSSWRQPVGSLLKSNFDEIWQSDGLDYYKHGEYAPTECLQCDDYTVCRGACPLYWQACGRGEIDGRFSCLFDTR